MAGSIVGSPEYLAETNDPRLDERVSIVFIVIDTLFLLLFYVSRHFNPEAVGVPMLVCNTLCYVFCMGSAATGICEFFPSVFCIESGFRKQDLKRAYAFPYAWQPKDHISGYNGSHQDGESLPRTIELTSL